MLKLVFHSCRRETCSMIETEGTGNVETGGRENPLVASGPGLLPQRDLDPLLWFALGHPQRGKSDPDLLPDMLFKSLKSS